MVNRITRKSKGGNKNKSLKKIGGAPGDGEKGDSGLSRQDATDIPSNYGTGLNDTHESGIKPPVEPTDEKKKSMKQKLLDLFTPSNKNAIGQQKINEIQRERREYLTRKMQIEKEQKEAKERKEEERIYNIARPLVKKEVFAEVGQSLKGINDRVGKLEADINMLQETKAEPVSAVKSVSAEEVTPESTEVAAENKEVVPASDGEEDLDASLTPEEENTNIGRWLKMKDAEQDEEEKNEEGSTGGKSRRRRRRSKGKSRRKRGRR
jgi:hypothetical protein